MLEIVKVIDNKPRPSEGQIWERDNAIYLLNHLTGDVVWAYKFQHGQVTEVAIDLKNSWRFKRYLGDSASKDKVIDAMADALYEQDDSENSDRIYELSKLDMSLSHV